MLPGKDAMRKIGSIGPLIPNLEARLVIEDVQEAEPGQPGEVWLRGPTIMKVHLFPSRYMKHSRGTNRAT